MSSSVNADRIDLECVPLITGDITHQVSIGGFASSHNPDLIDTCESWFNSNRWKAETCLGGCEPYTSYYIKVLEDYGEYDRLFDNCSTLLVSLDNDSNIGVIEVDNKIREFSIRKTATYYSLSFNEIKLLSGYPFVKAILDITIDRSNLDYTKSIKANYFVTGTTKLDAKRWTKEVETGKCRILESKVNLI